MDNKFYVKLVSPRMSLRPMDSEMKRMMSPPLSLITLATITPDRYRVEIDDENAREINYDDKPDLVGITVNVDTSYRAIEIAKKFRSRGSKVIFGGIHASADPDGLAPYSDSICIGEAEELWEIVLRDAENGNLQKIYQNYTPTNPEKIPIPDWKRVNTGIYLYNNVITASRGCPFKCDFCYNSCDFVKFPYRNRSVESVIAEIKTHKTRQIMFIDDNFIGNFVWTRKFMEAAKPMNLVWHAAVSANLVHHPDIIDEMAESGCRSLFIGFESINRKSIHSVNKKQNKIDDYERLIKMLHDHGIMINASLAFGFDHDDSSVFGTTLEWLVKNKIETMTAHILTPYPGTKFYKKLLSENRIIDYDNSHYNTANVVFKPAKMTPLELRSGYLKIYDDFYSVKNIWKRLPEKKSSLASFLLFNLGYRKYGKVTAMLGKLGLMHKIGSIARKLSYGID